MPLLRCDRCQTPLPDAFLNTPAPVACPGCRAPMLARVFPAFARGGVAPGQKSESLASDEDAGCFFHPAKKAVVPCGRCGRFLCALCDLKIDQEHVCPSCITAVSAPGLAGRHALSNERILYDQMALSLAVLPLLLWPLTLFAAPIALFCSIRYWNDPKRSYLPRRRTKLVVAALFALVELTGWGFVGYYGFIAHQRIPF